MTKKTHAQRVVEALDRMPQRDAFTRWNVMDWCAIDSEVSAARVMAQLLGAHCIEQVGGGGRNARMFRRIPGAPAPADARGQSEAAQLALQKGRALRLKASRGFVMRWKR